MEGVFEKKDVKKVKQLFKSRWDGEEFGENRLFVEGMHSRSKTEFISVCGLYAASTYLGLNPKVYISNKAKFDHLPNAPFPVRIKVREISRRLFDLVLKAEDFADPDMIFVLVGVELRGQKPVRYKMFGWLPSHIARKVSGPFPGNTWPGVRMIRNGKLYKPAELREAVEFYGGKF